jgi:hypothetical protein
MSNKSAATIATMGIDIGKNWFHAANGGSLPTVRLLARSVKPLL